jgi:hypothetical protein
MYEPLNRLMGGIVVRMQHDEMAMSGSLTADHKYQKYDDL